MTLPDPRLIPAALRAWGGAVVSAPTPYISADCLPGLLDGWDEWTGQDHDPLGCACDTCCSGPIFRHPDRFNARIQAHRDFLTRVLAGVLGVPVGATAPGWRALGDARAWRLSGGPSLADEWYFSAEMVWDSQGYAHGAAGALSTIPLDSPDRDALALAAVCRWVGDELRAGRITARGAATSAPPSSAG